MQSQNLTIDGGVTDIDSVERIDRLRGPSELFDAIIFSLYELTRSVLMGLGKSSKELTPLAGHVYGAILTEVRRALRDDVVLRNMAPDTISRWAMGEDDLNLLWNRADWDQRM